MRRFRRRRSKGSQGNRDLEEEARVLEEAEFGDFLGFSDRRSGPSGSEGDGDPGGGAPPDPTVTSPDPAPKEDSD